MSVALVIIIIIMTPSHPEKCIIIFYYHFRKESSFPVRKFITPSGEKKNEKKKCARCDASTERGNRNHYDGLTRDRDARSSNHLATTFRYTKRLPYYNTRSALCSCLASVRYTRAFLGGTFSNVTKAILSCKFRADRSFSDDDYCAASS